MLCLLQKLIQRIYILQAFLASVLVMGTETIPSVVSAI